VSKEVTVPENFEIHIQSKGMEYVEWQVSCDNPYIREAGRETSDSKARQKVFDILEKHDKEAKK
jgi:hypothetical protein